MSEQTRSAAGRLATRADGDLSRDGLSCGDDQRGVWRGHRRPARTSCGMHIRLCWAIGRGQIQPAERRAAGAGPAGQRDRRDDAQRVAIPPRARVSVRWMAPMAAISPIPLAFARWRWARPRCASSIPASASSRPIWDTVASQTAPTCTNPTAPFAPPWSRARSTPSATRATASYSPRAMQPQYLSQRSNDISLSASLSWLPNELRGSQDGANNAERGARPKVWSQRNRGS